MLLSVALAFVPQAAERSEHFHTIPQTLYVICIEKLARPQLVTPKY